MPASKVQQEQPQSPQRRVEWQQRVVAVLWAMRLIFRHLGHSIRELTSCLMKWVPVELILVVMALALITWAMLEVVESLMMMS